MENVGTAASSGASIVRHEFNGTSVEHVRETAQAAMVSQARAQIEAQYIVARANPRSWDNIRVKLLAECKRPAFAKAAWFRKPQGGVFVEGLSVRFAETALRLAGNLRRGTRTTYEDDTKRQQNVFVVDCETNAETSRDITLAKTVERKNPAGRLVLQQRTNSAGDAVYIVSATDDEMMMKEGAIVSKVARVLILQMIPGDILDDCRAQILRTRADEDAKDPGAARKDLMDAFAAMSVLPEHLTQYLGHEIAQCAPAEVEDLRGVYAALRDGEATWAEVLAEKLGAPASTALATTGTVAGTAEPVADAPKTRGGRLATRVRKNAGTETPSSTPATTAPVTPTPSAPATPPSQASKVTPGVQVSIPGTDATPATATRPEYVAPPAPPPQTLASSMSIEEERKALLAKQQELMRAWKFKLGDTVILMLPTGPVETSVTSGVRIYGDMAVVNVSAVDAPVHVEKIVAPPPAR